MADYTIKGLAELQAAVKRSPANVIREVGNYFVRALAAYRTIINRNPWRVGMTGGGAPVRTGYLRQTHMQFIETWQARIYPTAPYAEAVHGEEGQKGARPWLDFAKDKADKAVQALEVKMLDNIVADLGK